jgi:hypothetical protein
LEAIMANTNTPRGFVPLRDAGSKPHSGGLEMFYVPASDATALYIGDPVIKNGSSDTAGVAAVIRATAGAAITGVVQGFMPDGTVNMTGYRAASTAAYVLVNTDPDTLYEIQEDGVGGQLAAADIGLNADFIVAAGSAYTKRSGVMLDTSTKATTATLPLKIMGLSQRPGGEFGAYAKAIVKINVTTEANASAGI